MEKTDYKLLLSCPSGLTPSQVSVAFDRSYDRIPHPDNELENSIAKIWNEKVEKNASLFNGTKFRYGGYTLLDGDGSNQVSHAHLLLGLTDYRTFMGTNLNPLWESFLVPSEDDLIRLQHMSSPLGNGAIVESSDNKIVMLQRSHNVEEFPGYFVFPGGHPEPTEVGVVSHDSLEGFAYKEHINKKIAQEMFDSIAREVVEEIGVPAESLSNPLFIGISQRTLNVRPAAFFFINCSLDSEEIQRLYASAQDGYESTQLYTVSLNELENMASKMPGCHRGGFTLYKLMVESSKTI